MYILLYYIYICISTHQCIHVRKCTRACAFTYIYTYTFSYMYIYIYTYIHISLYVSMYTCIMDGSAKQTPSNFHPHIHHQIHKDTNQ